MLLLGDDPPLSSMPCCSVGVTKLPSLLSSHWQKAGTAQRYLLCSQGPYIYFDSPGHGHIRETCLKLLRKPRKHSPLPIPRYPSFFSNQATTFSHPKHQYLPHSCVILSTRLILFQQRPGRIFFHDSHWNTKKLQPAPYLPTHTNEKEPNF